MKHPLLGLLTAAGVLAALASPADADVVLDPFDSPDTVFAFDAAADGVAETARQIAAGVIGGNRDFFANLSADGTPIVGGSSISAFMSAGNARGFLEISSMDPARSRVGVDWGSRTLASEQLNLDVTALFPNIGTGLQFGLGEVHTTDLDRFDLKLTLASGVGVSPAVAMASRSISEIDDFAVLTWFAGEFAGIDFSDLDFIALEIDQTVGDADSGLQRAGVELESLTAVPEPSRAMLLVLGSLSMLLRRRR